MKVKDVASAVLMSLVVVPFLVGRLTVFYAGWSAAAQHYADTQKYIVDYGCNTGGVHGRSARAIQQCMQANADLQVWPAWRGVESMAANAFGLADYTFHILFIWESIMGKLLILAALLLVASKIYGGAESIGRTRAEWKRRREFKQLEAQQQRDALAAMVRREMSQSAACLPPPPDAATLQYRGSLGRVDAAYGQQQRPAVEEIDGGAPPRQMQSAW